jgi:ketosteroid isomerase-like protein
MAGTREDEGVSPQAPDRGGSMLGTDEVELVRRAYDAFVAGDVGWLHEHLHENVVYHVAGAGSLSGEQRGLDAVLAYLGKVVTVALPEITLHDIAAGEDHIVAVLEMTWRRPDGATFDGRAVQVFHVTGDKILESWFIADDQPAFDAFLDGGSAA